ncbi:unnamed protein product [Ceutorhynchus assimilis]|uniref:Uncharacterized protein n=1 Tax=Ceutorhynchus assimilis TaxID=467358 RepID=A0A9N9MKG7_9CUCU|nr:unnamed protein product [Ceutorhynchus assimilis]
MKNLRNQPTKTELVENTVSHISMFSWKTSEGKILELFACKEEGEDEKLIFPKFQFFSVGNNNMKNLGNQPTTTVFIILLNFLNLTISFKFLMNSSQIFPNSRANSQ